MTIPRTRRPRHYVDPFAIWAALDRAGLSQNEAAKLAGISSGYLSQLVTGRSTPSGPVRRRLSEALGIPLAALTMAEDSATYRYRVLGERAE